MTSWSHRPAVGSGRHRQPLHRLGEITAPTLFICGRYDEATPAATEFYHRSMPGSEFVVIEDASHLSHVEQPEAFCRAVQRLLARAE